MSLKKISSVKNICLHITEVESHKETGTLSALLYHWLFYKLMFTCLIQELLPLSNWTVWTSNYGKRLHWEWQVFEIKSIKYWYLVCRNEILQWRAATEKYPVINQKINNIEDDVAGWTALPYFNYQKGNPEQNTKINSISHNYYTLLFFCAPLILVQSLLFPLNHLYQKPEGVYNSVKIYNIMIILNGWERKCVHMVLYEKDDGVSGRYCTCLIAGSPSSCLK